MLRLIFLFFFLSGFSALIYEVAWVRELGLTLGNTAQATCTVLAVFLGGLAIGAFAGGKIADKHQNKALFLYAMLELTVGIVALFASQAIKASNGLYVWLYHTLSEGSLELISIRILIAVLILLVPTLLMGATLPVLVRYLEQFNLSTKLFSLLYGLNTLGAAAGSLTACFLGFAYLGLDATIMCAAAINLIIGGFSAYLSLRDNKESTAVNQLATTGEASSDAGSVTDVSGAGATSANENTPTPANPPERGNLRTFLLLCCISFLTGYTALSYEILWTRLLRFFLTSITYSFTIMISMFLFGLAIGSLLHEVWIVRRPVTSRDQAGLRFGIIQYIAAATCAGSLPLILMSPQFAYTLHDWGWLPLRHLYSQPESQLLYIFVVSTVCILIPAIFIGMLFPMIGTLATQQSHDKTATNVGIIYAANTIGCVAGSLFCGFVLMPMLGSFSAFQVTIIISAITGAVAIIGMGGARNFWRLALMVIPTILAITYMQVAHFVPSSGPDAKVLAYGEDATGAMRIVSYPKLDEIQLMLNGSCLATTVPPSRRYMRLLGHLPVLLHKNPKNVMLACFGTGTTCGSIGLHPEVERLDVVELSRMVIDAAPLFAKTNYDVLKNPKVVLHINDARNFLLTTDRQFNIITFEPPPPTEAGIVNLYTQEFYELVNRHLTNDGIMCQWIPMDQVPIALWKMEIITARTVFPYVSIWLPNNKEAILMASREPIPFDVANVERRFRNNPKVAQSLNDVGLGSPMALLATYVVSGQQLDDFIKDSPAITDDRPSLEFFLPYKGPLPTELQAEQIGLQQLSEFVNSHRDKMGFDENEFGRYWRQIHLLRESGVAPTTKQSDALINTALRLTPNNPWLKWVDGHRGYFYKGESE